MTGMNDPIDPTMPAWRAGPTTKARSAVQRSVTALLDQLVPEPVPRRLESPGVGVVLSRTPTGCVLQAADAAITVSWFADATSDTEMGELHVVSWRGTVTRRGGSGAKKHATQAAELVLKPIDPGEDLCVWRAADGTRYDTAALAAKCLALLEEQTKSA